MEVVDASATCGDVVMADSQEVREDRQRRRQDEEKDVTIMDAEGSLPANDAFMASSTIRVFSNSAHTESTLQECIPFRDHNALSKKIEEMEKKELNSNILLNSSFYSELLLCYLLQQNWIKAKYCRMRAKTLINEEIIQISHHLEHKETGPALVCLKMGTFPQYLCELVEELRKRTTIYALKLILRCYSIISWQKMALFLGMQEEKEVQNVLNEVKWSRNDNGLIFPSMTPEFNTLLRQIDVKLDSNSQWIVRKNPEEHIQNCLHTLDRIIHYASSLEES